MFNFRKLFAFLSEPQTPYDAALRALAHGRPMQAVCVFDALLLREDDRARRGAIANKRGVALVTLDRRADAAQAFQDALHYVREFPPALVNLGNLALERGETAEAAALYERAIASDGQYGPAHAHLAIALKRLGRTSDAFRSLQRARRLEGRAGTKQRP